MRSFQFRLIRALCAVIALAAMPNANAAVYKCPTGSGGFEYRQVACSSEDSGEVKIVDPTVPLSRSRAESGEVDANSLRGDWCEFAISLDADSEQDSSASAWWYFGADYLTYRQTGAQIPVGQELPKMGLRRSGKAFFVDHDMFAKGRAWDVVERRAGTILVSGPFGGIYHMRPGRC